MHTEANITSNSSYLHHHPTNVSVDAKLAVTRSHDYIYVQSFRGILSNVKSCTDDVGSLDHTANLTDYIITQCKYSKLYFNLTTRHYRYYSNPQRWLRLTYVSLYVALKIFLVI